MEPYRGKILNLLLTQLTLIILFLENLFLLFNIKKGENEGAENTIGSFLLQPFTGKIFLSIDFQKVKFLYENFNLRACRSIDKLDRKR